MKMFLRAFPFLGVQINKLTDDSILTIQFQSHAKALCRAISITCALFPSSPLFSDFLLSRCRAPKLGTVENNNIFSREDISKVRPIGRLPRLLRCVVSHLAGSRGYYRGKE